MTSYLQNRTANFLKFCIYNSLIPLIVCAKFQINQVIVTLSSGVCDKNPTSVVKKSLNSLAHKLNFAGHVIVTTRLQRMHFPGYGVFLRWNSNLQQVDFSQGFASNNILGPVVLAVNDGFPHLMCDQSHFSVLLSLHFCHLELQV